MFRSPSKNVCRDEIEIQSRRKLFVLLASSSMVGVIFRHSHRRIACDFKSHRCV